MTLRRRLGILRVVAVDECHIESRGPVARELEVLNLIFAHGNDICAESEDISGHEHRIREQCEGGGNAAGDLVLVAMGALEVGDRHERAEEPEQLADLRNVTLAKEDRPVRLEPQREVGERRLQRVFTQRVRIVDRRERVPIGYEVQRLAIVLQLDELMHGPEVVAHVEPARRLDARKNSQAAPACIGGLRNHSANEPSCCSQRS